MSIFQPWTWNGYKLFQKDGRLPWKGESVKTNSIDFVKLCEVIAMSKTTKGTYIFQVHERVRISPVSAFQLSFEWRSDQSIDSHSPTHLNKRQRPAGRSGSLYSQVQRKSHGNSKVWSLLQPCLLTYFTENCVNITTVIELVQKRGYVKSKQINAGEVVHTWQWSEIRSFTSTGRKRGAPDSSEQPTRNTHTSKWSTSQAIG